MKNLTNISFLLILLPQLSFFNWHSKYLLTVPNNFKSEITASKNSNFYRQKNSSLQTNLIAQNQSTPTDNQQLISNVTNLKSTAERMISYRHQRHMWITSDGAIHVLFNRGINLSRASLVLYSSFDRGRSWTLILSLPNTNGESTADGFLYKQKLSLAYSSATGSILFLPITYDSLAKKWTYGQAATVYQGSDFVATSPTIAFDSKGYLWAAFVVQQTFTKDYSISLFNSSNQGLNWANTYESLGVIDKSARKSARLVSLNDKLGIIYTNDDTFYWAYRNNNSPFNTPWQAQSIFIYQPGSNNSMYSSHFSLVADPLDNIHLATHNLGKLVYLKFDGQCQRWQPIKTLSNHIKVGYMQVSLSTDNNLFITYNRLTQVGVLRSSDYGKSFNFISSLSHPNKTDFPSNTVSFKDPRIITPAIIAGQLPLLQQFQIDGVHNLINFNLKPNAQSFQVPAN